MIAFDTDVMTEVLLGNVAFVERATAIPASEQAVPVIVLEEVMRGRLNMIRQAEAGKTNVSITRAYELFEQTFEDFRRLHVLSYTSQSDSFYRQWRQQGIRVGTHDLRIGAVCLAHAATLVSRNRQDFELIPGLMVEFW